MLLSDRTSLSSASSKESARAIDASRGWQGSLSLAYTSRDDPDLVGRTTELRHSQSQAPLRLQRSFYPEGPAVCQSVVVHTAGGMVGGDRLNYGITLEPNSRALITTAAAAKIYRSNGLEAEQMIESQVAAGACLEWLPQETIVFDQAHFRQSHHVELAPGGQWLGWEITRFGRTARGERFVAGEWRSHTEVWQQGRPLWIDRQWLPASPERWSSLHGLANCPILASFAWVGVAVEREWLAQVRQLAVDLGIEPMSFGVTRLRCGLLCRYRGRDRAAVQRWFVAVWRLIRQRQWGKSPPIPRVWQR